MPDHIRRHACLTAVRERLAANVISVGLIGMSLIRSHRYYNQDRNLQWRAQPSADRRAGGATPRGQREAVQNHTAVAERDTRQSQTLLSERTCGFESHPPYHMGLSSSGSGYRSFKPADVGSNPTSPTNTDYSDESVVSSAPRRGRIEA